MIIFLYFPSFISVIRYPDKKQFRQEGVYFSSQVHSKSIMAEKSRQWELKTSGHIIATAKDRKGMHVWLVLSSFFPLALSKTQTQRMLLPLSGWVFSN